MKFTTPICVNILSPRAMREPAQLIKAVQVFCSSLPQLSPDKWGWWEPLNKQFESGSLEQLIPATGVCETVYWQRKKSVKAEGAFAVQWKSKSPKVYDTHSNISFSLELGQVSQKSLIDYLKIASISCGADLALIDAVTKPYRSYAIESGSAPYGERIMVVTHLLRHWLPDSFWGTVFGPAYVRLLGRERLLTSPAFLVEQLGPEMVYVEMRAGYFARVASNLRTSLPLQ